MKSKTIFLWAIMVVMTSCLPTRQAKEKLSRFIIENVPDRRETVFNITLVKKGNHLFLSGETDSEYLKDKLLTDLKQFKLLDNITLLPDSSVGNKNFGLINVSVANLRLLPSHSAELVTQGLMGMPVKILKKSEGWYLVQTPDHYISWIDSGGISLLTEKEHNEWKKATRVIITEEFSGIYSKPEENSGIVSDVSMGSILEMSENTDAFLKVKLPDGRAGYIKKENTVGFDQFLEVTIPEKEGLIKLGRSFTGRPYLWGGTSARAMDCSGFVKIIYYMQGIILARDASLQARYGKIIPIAENMDNFEPGDQLFFGADSEHITHVAISTGKAEYIHASGMVQENSFNPGAENFSEYRKNSFICGRQIIGEEGKPGIIWIKDHPWYN